MDLSLIERAADTIFRMCAMHPEICPHDYSWDWSSAPKDGKRVEHYTCCLCGDKKEVEVKI